MRSVIKHLFIIRVFTEIALTALEHFPLGLAPRHGVLLPQSAHGLAEVLGLQRSGLAPGIHHVEGCNDNRSSG